MNRIDIGTFTIPISIKCGISNAEKVYGIDINKQIIETKANMAEIDTSRYNVIPSNCFAANFMHIGRDKIIPVAFNDTGNNLIVSPAYFTFKVDTSIILPEYFYIVMNSSEFDRYAWFCSDSSIRGNLDWDRFCEIEIELPPIAIQQKYVDVYNSLLQNQKVYKKGLDDLKLTCDAYIERLRREITVVSIGEYIKESDERNTTLQYEVGAVKGITTEKKFIETKANMEDVKLDTYKIVKPNQFAYVSDTSRRGDKISLALNDSEHTYLVSSISTVFSVKGLLPEYLFLFFRRDEFDRYTRFHSWGSAREIFSFDDMKEVKIPIPDVSVQQAIVDIFNAYNKRKTMAEKLKIQMKDICQVLIRGALEEAAKC